MAFPEVPVCTLANEWIDLYIRPNIRYLTNQLRVDLPFLQCLMEESLLDPNEVEMLNAMTHTQKVHDLFFTYLRGKGSDTFGRLCTALKKASYQFVVCHLVQSSKLSKASSSESLHAVPTAYYEKEATGTIPVPQPKSILEKLPYRTRPLSHHLQDFFESSAARPQFLSAPQDLRHRPLSRKSSSHECFNDSARKSFTSPQPQLQVQSSYETPGRLVIGNLPCNYKEVYFPLSAPEFDSLQNKSANRKFVAEVTEYPQEQSNFYEECKECRGCKEALSNFQESQQEVQRLKKELEKEQEENRSFISMFCSKYVNLEKEAKITTDQAKKAQEALEEEKAKTSCLTNELHKMKDLVDKLYEHNKRLLKQQRGYLSEPDGPPVSEKGSQNEGGDMPTIESESDTRELQTNLTNEQWSIEEPLARENTEIRVGILFTEKKLKTTFTSFNKMKRFGDGT